VDCCVGVDELLGASSSEERLYAVQSQATMISLNNIYRMVTGLMILALMLTVLLPRPAKTPAGAH